jgi:hypothetical protein
MENVIACVLMAAVSLPLSYYAARTCLRGVVRLVNGSKDRSML